MHFMSLLFGLWMDIYIVCGCVCVFRAISRIVDYTRRGRRHISVDVDVIFVSNNHNNNNNIEPITNYIYIYVFIKYRHFETIGVYFPKRDDCDDKHIKV